MLVNSNGEKIGNQDSDASIDRNVGIRARAIPQPNESSLRAHRKNLDTTLYSYIYRTYQFQNGTYNGPYVLCGLSVDDRQTLAEMARLNNFNISRRWT